MTRLLSPNEAKFWLLDLIAPMNSIVVVQSPGKIEIPASSAFALPEVQIGPQSRPRWSEAGMPGVVQREDAASDLAWLTTAERLLSIRVGSAGHPPWHALIQDHPGGTTLILAMNHALTDWRTSLHVARSLLAGQHPGELAPACEEMLPDSVFGAADAAELIEEWWASKAGARWEAAGLERLASSMPPPTRTRLTLLRLTQEETTRLKERCESEGVSLNGALAIALREVMQIGFVAHSVDMARFIRPPPPAGPGLAVAHIFTRLTDAPFWEAARDNRGEMFEQIRAGAAGDALLALPRALAQLSGKPVYQPAAMTITGAPTVQAGHRDNLNMQVVLSSARGGGGILIISYHMGCLQLIAGTPDDQPDVPLASIVECLLSAAT